MLPTLKEVFFTRIELKGVCLQNSFEISIRTISELENVSDVLSKVIRRFYVFPLRSWLLRIKRKLFLWKMSKSVNITTEGYHDLTSPHFVSHSDLNEHCGTLKSAKKDLLSYPKQNAHIAIAKVELSRHAKKSLPDIPLIK